ncbi:hypothetical protein [Enterobacter cloacae]|nr:hypothetical protein [Enterobacter cloacae]MCK6884624.1 hypothetical protein [Enterobacter cloacae]MCK7381533.1 hypothetical protein [Enterobacter cloacae]MDK9957928.1 hypothetical protein [Enterobacter cloacae]HAV2293173.1 hypothetical protein [Enterobacter cloacae]HAV2324699.1 hypothetical protein [Enterobacter cloacae]
MSTFTKEQLIARINQVTAINNYRISRDPSADGLAMDNELLAIALASLEAEPVAYVMADDLKDSSIISTPAYRDLGEAMERTVGDVVALFTAPPAPVSVMDEDLLHMAASAIEDLLSNEDRSGAGVWADVPAKLRRDAMLQGADGDSPVIPDAYDIEAFGVFSASEGEDGLLLQIENFRLGTENCPQIGKGNMVPKFALQAIINRLQEHCDSMENETLVNILSAPSAPQQEVK